MSDKIKNVISLLEAAFKHKQMTIARGIFRAINDQHREWSYDEKSEYERCYDKIKDESINEYTAARRDFSTDDLLQSILVAKILKEHGFISWEMLLLLLFAAEQKQKEQTLIDGESSIPKLRT